MSFEFYSFGEGESDVAAAGRDVLRPLDHDRVSLWVVIPCLRAPDKGIPVFLPENRNAFLYGQNKGVLCFGKAFFTEPLHPYSGAMPDTLPENGLQANMGFASPRKDTIAQLFYDRRAWRTERCRKAPPALRGENDGQRKDQASPVSHTARSVLLSTGGGEPGKRGNFGSISPAGISGLCAR